MNKKLFLVSAQQKQEKAKIINSLITKRIITEIIIDNKHYLQFTSFGEEILKHLDSIETTRN